ncbi:MAG: hypothetical protein AVDCRST_MAG24-1879, partial [uncultured Nocardioidaceae bacterium]
WPCGYSWGSTWGSTWGSSCRSSTHPPPPVASSGAEPP